MNYWIVESEVYSNTWFLFRENGQEIKITVNGGIINTSVMLLDGELKDFKSRYMRSPINNMKLKQTA